MLRECSGWRRSPFIEASVRIWRAPLLEKQKCKRSASTARTSSKDSQRSRKSGDLSSKVSKYEIVFCSFSYIVAGRLQSEYRSRQLRRAFGGLSETRLRPKRHAAGAFCWRRGSAQNPAVREGLFHAHVG